MKRNVLVIILFLISIPLISQNVKNDPYFEKGEKAMLHKKFNEAVKQYTLALDNNPKSIPALSRRGQAYMFLNKFQEAINDFTKIIQINPSLPDVYNYRGLAFGYLGEIDKAINDFDKAINLDKKFAEAYLNRGTAWASKSEYEKALKDYTQAINLNKNNAEAYYQRGIAYYNLDNLSKALNDFTQAIQKGIPLAKVYYYRGNTYYKLKNYNKAIQDYSKAIQLDPNDTEAINNRAMAYDLSGNKKAAQKDRDRLNQLAGNRFPPIESIKFTTYTDERNVYSIQLPENWHKLTNADKLSSDLYVTLEKINKNTEPYSVGVRLSMNRNLRQHYNIPQDVSLISFWEASAVENTKNYANYRIFTRKTHNINGYDGFLNKTLIKVTKESIPIRMYEIILTKGDDLFYGYFQAPEVQFAYFEKIFDKAIKTLQIK